MVVIIPNKEQVKPAIDPLLILASRAVPFDLVT